MNSSAKSAADSEARAALLRQIPSVDELLALPRLRLLITRADRGIVVEVARAVLADLRARITGERDVNLIVLQSGQLEARQLGERIAAEVERALSVSLLPVINATGVILHTNLGRAPLSAESIDHLRQPATRYSNLEYDLEAGARGKRDTHTARLLERLTGAEAAIVVNNCAAAVLLVLAALAKGGEVIVSRGELIEIGDGFRIPEIMAESGALLHEVGTTNRTKLADYESAINDRTRLFLRVHPSNFRVVGFTERPALEELAALAARSGLPLMEDLGSGCLVDLSAHGVKEPVVHASIAAGASLVTFSGDKMVGGPQAGIIAGQKELVGRIRRHPLFRALRVDKLSIAALETTLSAYLSGNLDEVPTLRMIRLGADAIGTRARDFVFTLRSQVPAGEVELDIVPGASLIGGGSTPDRELSTHLIRITSARYSAAQLQARLRRAPKGISVIARVEADRLIIDLRTVFPEQEDILSATLVSVLH